VEEVQDKENMKRKTTIYVIQKHNATHLHYDLRLEMDGVLKSWAVPKRPPLKKNVKRLAIQTEDHALDYAKVAGVISTGKHGVETVEIWDTGTYIIEGRGKDIIVFHLKGKKLKGRYCLVRLKGQEKNWLFFKS
jgi:bifunctional non-homologous end joining protein LigD